MDINMTWIFSGNRLIHTPCNEYIYPNIDNKLICSTCNEQLPEYLELSASVFGIYKQRKNYANTLGDILLKMYSPTNIKTLQNMSYIDKIFKNE